MFMIVLPAGSAKSVAKRIAQPGNWKSKAQINVSSLLTFRELQLLKIKPAILFFKSRGEGRSCARHGRRVLGPSSRK